MMGDVEDRGKGSEQGRSADSEDTVSVPADAETEGLHEATEAREGDSSGVSQIDRGAKNVVVSGLRQESQVPQASECASAAEARTSRDSENKSHARNHQYEQQLGSDMPPTYEDEVHEPGKLNATIADMRGAKNIANISCPVTRRDIEQFIESFGLPTLANATAGKDYREEIYKGLAAEELRRLLALGVTLRFPLLDSVGLSFDANDLVVAGTPIVSGIQKYELEFQYLGISSTLSVKRDYDLMVNSDPRSLWKEIEPDPNLPYSKSNTDSRREFREETLLIGASRRGRSHAHKGTHRDDDFTIGSVGDGWILIAVADGAGSAKFSRRGSQILCGEIRSNIGDAVRSHLSVGFEQVLRQHCDGRNKEQTSVIRNELYSAIVPVAYRAVKCIEAEANQEGAKLKDYATTLVLTLSKRFSFGWFVACFAIGDGGAGVIVEPETQNVQVLNRQDGGEFSGQTRFATMADIWKDSNALSQRIQFTITKDMVALLAMTDGVSDAYFKTERDFDNPERWVEFWNLLRSKVDFGHHNEASAEQLLEWLGFWVDGEHDDRTIALAIPATSAI